MKKIVIILGLCIILMSITLTISANELEVNQIELKNKILEETDKTFKNLGIINPGIEKQNRVYLADKDNQIFYNLVEEKDMTDSKDLIRKSYIEPVIIYSAKYVGAEVEPNQRSLSVIINKIETNTILFNGDETITYTIKTQAYKREHDNIDGDETNEYKLKDFEFSWEKNTNSAFDGITSIQYRGLQTSYKDFFGILSREEVGNYGWPDHHTFGLYEHSFTTFDTYVVCVEGISGNCGNVVEIFYDTFGGSQNNDTWLKQGWGTYNTIPLP